MGLDLLALVQMLLVVLALVLVLQLVMPLVLVLLLPFLLPLPPLLLGLKEMLLVLVVDKLL